MIAPWTFKSLRTGSLVVLYLLLAGAHGRVAAESYFFRPYSSADGLSQAVIQVIYQDRAGYLWVGTQAGLNRYDGASFTIYNVQKGLANDWIRDILEDARGQLWLATLGGVSSWDGNRFRNYSTADGLIDNRVTAMALDQKGALWCATPRGISRSQDQQWRTYSTVDGLPSPSVNALLVDDKGRMWAGTAGGLAYLEGEKFLSFDPEGLRGLDIRCLARDQKNRLWIGSNGGVRVYQDNRLIANYTQAGALSSLSVTSLWIDRHGVAWVGTPHGLAFIRDNQVKLITARNGLRYSDVRRVFEDREGLIWIGTYGALYKFSGRPFTNYTVADGLGSDSIRPILRDRRGALWVGTTGGLSRFDGSVWRSYTVADGLADNSVLALLEDRKGLLWIGTRGGLTFFDGTRFRKDPALNSFGRIMAFAEDKSGTVWCATQPGGLFKWAGRRFEPVVVENQSFSNARLIVDHEGRLWASGDDGLSRWDGRNWQTFTTKDGLSSNQPYYLCEDKKGLIWLGYHSSHGLSSFNGTHFRHFTTARGLSNNAVYSLGVDRKNNLWIGTARGVDRFNGQRFTNFGTDEGYADNESNAGGFFADRDETLWFGTVSGLSHFDPTVDLAGGTPPVLELAELGLGNHHFSPGESPTVEHRQNELTARIVALSFWNEKKVRVQYRLPGFQNKWTRLEGRQLRIMNLPPRSYSLEIRGRKIPGPWSQVVRSTFTIRPPFWQTWLFWVLSTTLGLATLYGGYRVQAARARRRAEELEQKVHERTVELAQKTEELESFIYTISHDLKAPVVSLQGLASLLQLELGSELKPDAALYLERIHANTVHMQRLISELLKLSRIGRLREPQQPVEMKELVHEVVNELQGQVELKKASIIIADDLPTVVCERERLVQVWMNLIANALNYSQPEVPPVVEIGSSNGKAGFQTFFAKDNGIGVAKEHQDKVFEIFYRVEGKYNDSESTGVGLAIVKRIIDSHGGGVWVESAGRGSGATFWFTLPKNGMGDSSGDLARNSSSHRS